MKFDVFLNLFLERAKVVVMNIDDNGGQSCERVDRLICTGTLIIIHVRNY